MPVVFRLALLLDLSMIWCENSFPGLDRFWPFAMGHALRLSLFLIAAMIYAEARDLLTKTRGNTKDDAGDA